MDIVESNLTKLEQQLKGWSAHLNNLANKVEKDATAEYRKNIDDLKAKHLEAETKFNQLKAGGHDKWDTLKTGVETAWHDLEDAFTKLKVKH